MSETWIELQLNIDSPTEVASEVAFEWLETVTRHFAGDELDELAQLPAQQATGGVVPGAAYGVIGVRRWVEGKRPRSTYRNPSRAGLEWLRKEFRDFPFKTNLYVGRYDESGGQRWTVEAFVERHPESPQWVWLRALLPEHAFTDPGSGPTVQARSVDILRRFADKVDPGYGQIGYALDEGATAFESALRAPGVPPDWWAPERAVNFSREALRGYSWVTIIPAELVPRVGGYEGLQTGGFLAEVQQLSSGGIWLRATTDFRDYDDSVMLNVFKSVAPLLRPGTPQSRPRIAGQPPIRAVFRDASDPPSQRAL